MSRQFDKLQWKGLCSRLSRSLEGLRAEIEVASLDLGDQIEAEWLPLLGLAYDPKADVLEIALDGLDHMIARPQRLQIQEGPQGIASINVVDIDGVQQIIKLREPLMLPPPNR